MARNLKKGNLRLSPNELQELVRQEREKRRIFRIQQVREQAREEARRVRDAVATEKSHMIQDLQQELRQQWQAEKENELLHWEMEYQGCLLNLGRAHKLAEEQPDATAVLHQQAMHNRRVAERRGREGRKLQREEEKLNEQRKNRTLKQRQAALQLEKQRANQVAKLPTPEAFKEKIIVKKESAPKVELYEAGTFTTTHYLPKNLKIVKEVYSTKPSAKEVAAAEEEAQAERREAERREAAEKECKREQRGREALQREHIAHTYRHLLTQLEKAQAQHQLSHYLHGKDSSVYESAENRLKGQATQQRQMEEAAERLLQREEVPPDLGRDREQKAQHTSQESSGYLETVDSSTPMTQDLSLAAKHLDLKSFLREIERKRNNLIQEYGNDSFPARGTSSGIGSDEAETEVSHDTTPGDQDSNIHLAETVPVHLHRGHTRQQPQGPTHTVPSEHQPDTSDDRQTSTSGEVSIPSLSSMDSTRYIHPPPSLPTRLGVGESEPQSQLMHPRDTQTGQATASSGGSFKESSSDDIEIDIDINGGSSTLETVEMTPATESSLRRHPEYLQTELSSTDYMSPPSALPRSPVSYQEIEDNLKRIHKQRKHNQDLIDSLSSIPKKSSPLGSTLNTYLEKLKEEGSGKKCLKKKEKFELMKKEVIHFYMKKLLQMEGHQLASLSASTVEDSGLTISSLGSLLNCLEGDKEDLPRNLTPLTSSLASSRSLSAYEDIDEVPVKLRGSDSLKAKETHGHHITSTPNADLPTPTSTPTTESYDPTLYPTSLHTLHSTVSTPNTEPYDPTLYPTFLHTLHSTASTPTTEPYDPTVYPTSLLPPPPPLTTTATTTSLTTDSHHTTCHTTTTTTTDSHSITNYPVPLASHHTTSTTTSDPHHVQESHALNTSIASTLRRLKDVSQKKGSPSVPTSATCTTTPTLTTLTTSSTSGSHHVGSRNESSCITLSSALDYHTPSREDESSLGYSWSQAPSEPEMEPGLGWHPTEVENKLGYGCHRHTLLQQAQRGLTQTYTTDSSNEKLNLIYNKLPMLSGRKLGVSSDTTTSIPPMTPPAASITSNIASSHDIQRGIPDSAAGGAAASSSESVVSMPDMAEVLRRFGLHNSVSGSSSSTSPDE